MLTLTNSRITIERLPDKLGDYLTTYVQQYNELTDTLKWQGKRVPKEQRREWESTLEVLRKICFALDAGFDPYTPPSWPRNTLAQYLAGIPVEIRERIDKALPIFGESNLLVHDPNITHFLKPKQRDPVVTGSVRLYEETLYFLIGQWSLAEDLKLLDTPQLDTPQYEPHPPEITSWPSFRG